MCRKLTFEPRITLQSSQPCLLQLLNLRTGEGDTTNLSFSLLPHTDLKVRREGWWQRTPPWPLMD